MPSARDTVFARILQLTVVGDESADTIQVSANGIKFFRSRQQLDAADGYNVPFSGGAAAANMEVQLSTVIPPFSVIRLVFTQQA